MINALKSLKAILTGNPLVLYHQPTYRCDCQCEFCNVWEIKPGSEKELTPSELQPILRRAREAGFTTHTLLGGEPLYYSGIGEITRAADELGFQVIMCTNGSRLKELSRQIAPHIYYLVLSLEAVGEKHDQMRKHPGLFQKALAGAEAFQSATKKGRIIIWCHLNRNNQDQVRELCRLASRIKAFVEFFPTVTVMGGKQETILDPRERKELFGEIIRLKQAGYPITNTNYALELMKKSASFQCNIPKVAVVLLWDGTLWPCEPRLVGECQNYGPAGEIDFKTIRNRKEFQKASQELEKCNHCLLPCVTHFANNIWLQGLRRFFNQIYYRNYYAFPSGGIRPP